MADEIDISTGEIIEHNPQRQQTHQFLLASAQTDQVWTALLRAQAVIEMPHRTKTGKVQGRGRSGNEYSYEYKYAPLEEIIDKIRQPLIDESLGKQQYLAQRGGMWVMRTVIFHSSGQWVAGDYPIFWDEGRGAQAFASGASYARRYGLMLLLGLAAEEDNDGAAASAPASASAEPADDDLHRRILRAAQNGYAPLGGYFAGLPKEVKATIPQPWIDEAKEIARKVDAAREKGENQ